MPDTSFTDKVFYIFKKLDISQAIQTATESGNKANGIKFCQISINSETGMNK